MPINFSKWAVVAHKDDSGFGRQAADIRSVLKIGYHFVTPSERMPEKPLSGSYEKRLDPKMSIDELRELLRLVEGIIFFERSDWHPELLATARALNVKTVCVPNWEWFRGDSRSWEQCDLFACPTRFTVDIVRGYGRQNSIYLPWTMDIEAFSARRISGQARLFVHNAGLMDTDDRKGTRDTIVAFKKTRRKDIRLLVRLQKPADLPEPDERIEVRVGNLEHPSQLYEEGDVAVQPYKMEGIGSLVLEPVCCGMPVITTDYPPMNEYVSQKQMLVRKCWFKRRAVPTATVKHAHLRLPSIPDLCAKIEWCADNDLSAISQQNRTWAKATFDRDALRAQWSSALGSIGG